MFSGLLWALCFLGLSSETIGDLPKGYTIPVVDLASEQGVITVDREAGQYLGHPTAVLLEDDQTILCVYPKGHGRGSIVYRKSMDGGKPGPIDCPLRRIGKLPKRFPRFIAWSIARERND